MAVKDPAAAGAAREDRKAARQAERRAHLLALARELVAAEGLAALTAPRLAAAAHLSVPALYYYFDGWDALLEELGAGVLEEETDAVLAAVDAAADGPAALQALVRARVGFYRARPGLFRLVQEAATGLRISPETFARRVYPASRRLMDPLEARLRGEQQAGRLPAALDPRRLANVAFCTAQGLLAVALGIERMGGEMRYATDALVDEACLALALACRPDAPGSAPPA